MKLSQVRSELSFQNKAYRLLWGIAWTLLFYPTPRPMFAWRRFLLRCFGAKVGREVRVYGSAKVFFPPNLNLDDYAIVGPNVDLYCVDAITIGEYAMVSQYSYLCTASHDYLDTRMPLITAPIRVETGAWICARAFIGPGVVVGQKAVVAACAVVTKPVGQGEIVAGNPAKVIKRRPADDQTATP